MKKLFQEKFLLEHQALAEAVRLPLIFPFFLSPIDIYITTAFFFTVKKNFLLFLLSVFLFVSLLQPVFSDGGMVIFDPDVDGWRAQKEERQLCAINYENGIQNMVLAVELPEMKGEKAVWIFPVPAKPDEITLDILEEFPAFRGRELQDLKNDKVSGMFLISMASQVYTLPFAIIFLSGLAGSSVGAQNKFAHLYGNLGEVTVHEHIEKMGLTTELITAEDGKAFYDYLYSNDLKLPMYIEKAFKEYIGKDYSFVVSWVSDVNEFNKTVGLNGIYGNYAPKGSLGVFVSFPTEKIYFPLKPTSIYKEAEIPVLLYITGYVTPELYSGIKDKTETEYFVDEYYNVSEKSKAFFNKKEHATLKYTKIKITSSAENFTEDLWIKKEVPVEIKIDKFIVENSLFFALIFFILSSCLASLIAGFIVFHNNKPQLEKFALFGLANFLTLLGFAVLAYFYKINKRFALAKDVKTAGIKKVLTMSALISGIIVLLLSSPFTLNFLFSIVAILTYANFEYLIISFLWMLFGLIVFFAIIFALLFPIIWGYYNNRKVMYFTIAFAFLFWVTSILFWIIFMLI